MKKATLGALLVLVIGCAPDAAGPVGTTALQSQSGSGSRYIVQLSRGSDPAAVAASVGAAPKHVYRHAIKGFAADLSDAAVEALERNPNVISIEPDGVVRVSDTQPNPPNWGLDRIDQRSLPLSGSYTYPNDGSGVHVYIIDTGIHIRHQEFGGRASHMATFVPEDGWNGEDCYGHGTHVAGTVGGINVGVAKGVRLYNLRVLDCGGSGTWEGVIAALDLVASQHQSPCVVNMSLGGAYAQAVNDATQGVIAAGCVVAVAAGNSSADACFSSPASSLNALTVNASRISDFKAGFSNYGACTDLYAPGVDIYSAAPTEVVGQPSCDTCYASWSGTSMATPHVAGAAALILSSQPGLTPAQVADLILGAATVGAILENPDGTPNLLLYVGAGGQDPPTEPPPPPADNASFSTSCSGFTCTFTAVSSGAWAFGDGTGAVGQQVSHTFGPRRSYNVVHTVGGASASDLVQCNPKRCR
jgi:subtilisin family serine protease